MIKICRFLRLSTVAVVVSACSGSTVSVDISAPIEGDLRPIEDGFSFANFPSSGTEETFNAQDLYEMFGAEACADGVVEPCTPIAEAAAWARMVNQARMSGHCEGMVVESSKRFINKESPATSELSNDVEVVHRIFRQFSTQFFQEVVDERDAWAKKSLAELVNAIAEGLQSGSPKFSMGIYSENGGHAVLPYAINPLANGVMRVLVYDSNWPGKERYVDIDTANKLWRFSFSGADPENDAKAWTGGKGDIDLNSLDARQQSTCPFCKTETKVKNSVMVLRSVDKNWTVANENGVYSPSIGNVVEGINARVIKSAENDGSAAFEYVVSLAGSKFTFKPKGIVSAFVVGAEAITQIETVEVTETSVEISANAITSTDSGATLTVANNDLVAQVAGENSEITVSGDELDLYVESKSGAEINLTVSEENRQIRVVTNGNASTGVAAFTVQTEAEGTVDLRSTESELPTVLVQSVAELPVDLVATSTTTTVPPTITTTIPPTTSTSSTTTTVPPTTTTSSTTTTTTSTTTTTVAPTTTTSSTTTSTTSSTTTSTTVALQSQSISIDSGSYVSSYRMAATAPTVTSTALGSGAKTYASASPSVCSIGSSTGAVSFVAAGTCRLNVNIAADSTYAFATSAQISFSLVYQVGDTGPGGGKIFMTPSSGSNTTNFYFESALSGWNGDSTDTLASWCSLTNQYLGSSGVAPQLTSIGSGSSNTNAMVAAGKCTSGAATIARAYSGGGLSDWYLPSLDELQQMYAQRATIGGFNLMTEAGTARTTTTYWSSSEDGSQNFYARSWSFATNGNDNWTKSLKFGVRPIRSFEPIS
ncbi:MAG: hypothetical protein RL729_509 [Actinomycetota bacterium]|jgi:hypothetical protein